MINFKLYRGINIQFFNITTSIPFRYPINFFKMSIFKYIKNCKFIIIIILLLELLINPWPLAPKKIFLRNSIGIIYLWVFIILSGQKNLYKCVRIK